MDEVQVDLQAVQRNQARFAVGKKCYGVLIHQGHIPQIEHDLLPCRLDHQQLLELLDILRLRPATESEDHLIVC